MWITLFIIHFARKFENNNLFKSDVQAEGNSQDIHKRSEGPVPGFFLKNTDSQPVPIVPTACQLFFNKVIHISFS